MALNWTMLNTSRQPIPLPGEVTITVENGSEVVLHVRDNVTMLRKLKELGRLYLTDKRLIFVASTPNKEFDSLSVLLASILSTSFEQPVFGSNYLNMIIKPSLDGGLQHETIAEVRLKDRGVFQFVSLLDKSRERAIYMKRQEHDGEPLPLYEPSAEEGPEASTSASRTEEIEPGELPPSYDS